MTSCAPLVIPAIKVLALDYYNQTMSINLSSTIAISIPVTQGNNTKSSICGGRNPYVSGDTIDGTYDSSCDCFVLSSVQVFCSVGYNLTVDLTTTGGKLISANADGLQMYSPTLSTSMELRYRNCRRGEFQEEGQCLQCISGTYSLEDRVDSSLECKICSSEDGISECYGDQVILDEGFWRRFSTNAAVLECRDGWPGCEGGNLTGDASCKTGYTGPLCSICANEYFNNGDECQSCDDTTPSTRVILYMLILFILSIVGARHVYINYVLIPRLQRQYLGNDKDKEEKEKDGGGLTGILSRKTKQSLVVKLKILVSTYQIVAETSTTLQTSTQAPFTGLIAFFSFFNVNFGSLLPIACSADYNYMHKLLLVTLSPIAVSLFIVCGLFVEMAMVKDDADSDRGVKNQILVKKYLNFFFYLTYLVLPSVTTYIFQMFLCQDLDPNNEDSAGSDYYHTQP